MKRLFQWLVIGSICGGVMATTSGVMAESPYSVQFRPGFMTGNNDVGTDANLDILIPLWGDKKRLLFFNPNFRFDDNDGNEQNVGFGFRRMSDCGHFILGANLFYDTMRSENDQRYHQVGVGAELLSHWLDLRGNYYDPFGDTKNAVGGGTATGYFFSGHSLLSSGGLTEEALNGFDAEVSVLVPGISDIMETRLAATYYDFDVDNGQDLDGWRSRIEIRPVRAVNLSLEYRDDDVRGGDTFFGGYLELPFSLDNLLAGKNPFAGAGDLWRFGKGVRPLDERMTDKVIRDRHIVAAATKTEGGGDGRPVVDNGMIFVNQDNEAPGDGSFENPYQTLEQAAADPLYKPGSWVYVFSSDARYANTSFTLLDDMVFWGQGYAHPVYGLGGGLRPILDGGGNDSVVTLANNNEVMGFTIQNGGHGIYGRNVKGATIHDNILRANVIVNSGIHIENNWTPADIDGQTLAFRFMNNQILDNSGSGIYLYNRISGQGKVENTSIINTFSKNTVQGNSGHGINTNTYSYLPEPNSFIAGSTFSNTFTGNTVGGSGEGQGNGYSGISANTELYTNGAASPISTTTLTNRYEKNTVVNNGRDGISDDYLYVYTGGSDSGLSNVRINRYITDNEVRDNLSDGYNRYSTQLRTGGANSPIVDSSISSQIGNNIISGNGRNAIDDSGPQISTHGIGSPISRSSITNAFTQNQLSVSASGYDGIKIYASEISSFSANSGLTDTAINNTFTGNTLSGAGSARSGIYLGAPDDGPSVNIQVSDASSVINRATITNTFTGNSVSNFLGDGIHFPGLYIQAPYVSGASVTGSSITNLVTDNIVTDNGGYGIYNWRNQIRAYTGGVTNSGLVDTYTGNTVSRNGLTGIYLDSDFTGGTTTSMKYTFTNNTIIGNGLAHAYDANGLYLYIDPSNGDLIDKRLKLQGNNITGNYKYGVELYVNGTTTADFKGDFGGGALGSTGGNTFSGNGTYDIYHRGNGNMDVWALNNNWTNATPESTIYDKQDSAGEGDVITSQQQ